MKSTLLILSLLLCASAPLRAQSRILAGVAGGSEFGNDNLGVAVSAELPFAHRFEADIKDVFSPLENHAGYGHGTANVARAGGIAWITNNVGITGSAEYSDYHVTTLAKGAYYSRFGPIVRFVVAGMPSRVSVSYARQFHDGITPAGVESSHLQGAVFSITTRMGCAGNLCFRVTGELVGATFLQQGNPICDGSRGAVTCPRQSATGGGGQVLFQVEFPRYRDAPDIVPAAF